MDTVEPALSELISRCADTGRRDLLDALVKRLQPRVAAVVARTLRRYSACDAELVKDLSQDALFKILGSKFKLRERARGRTDAEILGLVGVTAANLVLDAVRNFKPHVPLDTVPEISRESDIERNTLLQEVNVILEKLLVPPNGERDRRIFWFYHRERMTAKEIALLPGIGLTVKGVESVVYRVTGELRQALAATPPKGISAKGAF